MDLQHIVWYITDTARRLWAATRRDRRERHIGATAEYAAELHHVAQQPTTAELPPTRQEAFDERAELSHILNDIEATLFAGLNDVFDRLLADLDVSYADLAQHHFDGVRELAGVTQ